MGKRKERGCAYWRGVIEACQASGLPVKVFCEQRGLSAEVFYAWRSRLRKEAPKPGRFVAVGGGERIEVELPSGVKLRIPEGLATETLQRVMQALSC